MLKIYKLAFVVSILGILVSCFSLTYGPEFDEYNPFIKNTEGRIYFYATDSRKYGCGTNIIIDGKHIGTTGWDWTFFYIDLPKGKYKITAHRRKRKSIAAKEALEINISGGDAYYVETVGSSFSVRLLLKNWEESRFEIRKCRYMDYNKQ